jgi:hypothetical protein
MAAEATETGGAILKKDKKRKKDSSMVSILRNAEQPHMSGSMTVLTDKDIVKKKKKKRKLEEVPDASALLQSPEEDGLKKKSKKKKQNLVEQVEASPLPSDSLASETLALPGEATPEPASPPKDPAHVDNFPLSPAVKAVLLGKGIEALFPIQAMCLQHVLDSSDVVGRAR